MNTEYKNYIEENTRLKLKQEELHAQRQQARESGNMKAIIRINAEMIEVNKLIITNNYSINALICKANSMQLQQTA